MCGIGGVVGVKPQKAQLAAMAAVMEHRGPDDEGFYISKEVGFAFRRLAIVDLNDGRQPMPNEDETVWVVFNGEIYNHRELRTQLEKAGHRFSTDHSDTEVLVHGWEEWGEDLFPRLNGMFAVAVWDEKQRTLVLARDRYGIKPLYFAESGGKALVFGSEIRVLHASGMVERRPNPAGILEYFSFQNLWAERTMFESVQQFEPGCCMIWKHGKSRVKRFWDLTFSRSRVGTTRSLAEQHREILLRVLKRQIAADVPVMSYLSGGIDSTSVTVGAHRLNSEVKAYSCIFDLNNVGDDRVADEREYSRLVAQDYDLDRVELELSQRSLMDCLKGYVTSLEDLRMGMGYPVYLIAERVAQDAKAVLSGTGGDEYHGGYIGRYDVLGLSGNYQPPYPPRRRWYRSLLERLRGRTVQRGLDRVESRYRAILNVLFKPENYGEIFTPEFLKNATAFDANDQLDSFIARCPNEDWRDRVMYVDAKTYLTGLLTLEDRLSMAHSLETRVPLLDNELVDFILDVPWEHLIQGDTGKVLFRESVKPWVPKEIYDKPKMGFGPPDASWYRGALKQWIDTVLNEASLSARGIFRPQEVRRIVQDHFDGKANNTYFIWSLLNFEAWCEAFDMF